MQGPYSRYQPLGLCCQQDAYHTDDLQAKPLGHMAAFPLIQEDKIRLHFQSQSNRFCFPTVQISL